MEFGFPEVLSMAQTVGIVGSFVMAIYYSRREISHLHREFQTQVISELTEKLHRVGEIILEHPSLAKLINQNDPPEHVFAIYILSVYNQAFNMHKRKLVSDEIWLGWTQMMKSSFREGIIGDYWKKLSAESRFSSDFRHFINNTIIAKSG